MLVSPVEDEKTYGSTMIRTGRRKSVMAHKNIRIQ